LIRKIAAGTRHHRSGDGGMHCGLISRPEGRIFCRGRNLKEGQRQGPERRASKKGESAQTDRAALTKKRFQRNLRSNGVGDWHINEGRGEFSLREGLPEGKKMPKMKPFLSTREVAQSWGFNG